MGGPSLLNYGSAGGLDSVVDPLSNVTYYGYDSFLDRTTEVSARWKETGTLAPWTTYYSFDQLGRRTKKIDRQANITYFDWTSRCDPMDMVDPLGTKTAFTYDGLRRRTQVSVTDGTGTLLVRTKAGYDIYSNRTQTQDGLGNTTYFFYDQVNRPTARKDALLNNTYFYYDSVGNRTSQVDARGNPSYYFYDLLARPTAARDALANLNYYFYDLANNRTHAVDAKLNATYYFYDQLDRRQAMRDALGNLSYYFYDSVGNSASQVNALGRPTYFGYDAANRRTAMLDALGNSTYYTFDAVGNQTKLTDARANATNLTYDTLDRLGVTLDALSNPTYYGYDSVGNRTKQLDARFNATYYFYDGLRRQSATRDALGNPSYYFYDLTGNRTVTLNARFAPVYFGYDALNRGSKTQDALGNTTYYTFDAVGNTTKVTDPRSNVTSSGFDVLNRLSAGVDALSNATYYFYDAVGNQTSILNARLKPTYFGYDALNRRSKTQDALGNTTYYTFDALGNRTATIDARGSTSATAYDALNRQRVVGDAVGNETLFGYDAVGNLTAQDRGALGYGIQPYGTSPYGGVDGVTTYFYYDQLNRRSAVRDPLAGYSYYFYDAVGNQTATRNPLLHATYFGYDALNRRSKTQDALGATTYYDYDAVGNQTKVTDPDAHATVTGYDLLNRPTAILYPDAGAAYFYYDATSNRTVDLDPRRSPTYYGYDALNRPVRLQDGLGKTCYYTYDAVGNLASSIDAEASSATFTYDAVNRKTVIAYAIAGAIVSDGLRSDPYYAYDQVGNLTQMGDLWGLHRMGYDAANRPTQHQYPNTNVVYYSYDTRNNVTSRIYPGVAGISGAAYDALDRQTRIQAPSGATAYFAYDAASNLTQRLLGNASKVDATYDNAERIQNWRHSKAGGAPLAYFDYTRDTKGLITRCVRESTYATYYSYDACDRLTAEIWTTVGGSPSEVYGFRYAYDVSGNRTKALVNGQATYYSYDNANQLTVKGTNAVYASPTYYTYDQNGSLISLIEPTGTTKFAYNAAGLIARTKWRDATSTYFFYDGALQRYALNQNGTLNYFVWDGMDLLQELNANNTVKEEYTQAKSPTGGIGQLVETNRPGASPQKIYPVMDPRGSITKYLQSDGTTVQASREYDAFGGLIPSSQVGTWPGIFGYQGQAWMEVLSADGTQRLLLSPTRLYEPSIGRFLSRDPVKRSNCSGVLNSQGLYLYTGQTPTAMVDPDGRDYIVHPPQDHRGGPLTPEQLTAWYESIRYLRADRTIWSFWNNKTKQYDIVLPGEPTVPSTPSQLPPGGGNGLPSPLPPLGPGGANMDIGIGGNAGNLQVPPGNQPGWGNCLCYRVEVSASGDPFKGFPLDDGGGMEEGFQILRDTKDFTSFKGYVGFRFHTRIHFEGDPANQPGLAPFAERNQCRWGQRIKGTLKDKNKTVLKPNDIGNAAKEPIDDNPHDKNYRVGFGTAEWIDAPGLPGQNHDTAPQSGVGLVEVYCQNGGQGKTGRAGDSLRVQFTFDFATMAVANDMPTWSGKPVVTPGLHMWPLYQSAGG